MLTPLDVYLVMQVDEFRLASSLLMWSCFFLIPILSLFLQFESEKSKKLVTYGMISSFVFAVLFLTLSVFIPSSQTLGAMYLVPQVVNSKQAQKLDALSLKILDLVDHVADKADEALKEGK